MIEARIPSDVKHIVAQKAFETAAKMDGLVVATIDGAAEARAQHFDGELLRCADHLRTWEEAGVAKVKTKTTPKVDD